MIRLSYFTMIFALVAAPAFAHDGAGLTHFLTQADHVAGLIAAIALPGLFWLVLRGKAPLPQRQKIQQKIRKD